MEGETDCENTDGESISAATESIPSPSLTLTRRRISQSSLSAIIEEVEGLGIEDVPRRSISPGISTGDGHSSGSITPKGKTTEFPKQISPIISGAADNLNGQ